jgi:PAS domain-containing protein
MTMDAMQDGVLRIDRQGQVVSANPMALDLLGLGDTTMTGQSVHDLLPGKQHGHDLAFWLPMSTGLLLRCLAQNLQEDPELVHTLPIPLLTTASNGPPPLLVPCWA